MEHFTNIELAYLHLIYGLQEGKSPYLEENCNAKGPHRDMHWTAGCFRILITVCEDMDYYECRSVRRVDGLLLAKSLRAQTSSLGVEWKSGERMPPQVSFSSLDHVSKLRCPSPKALMQLNIAILILTHSRNFRCSHELPVIVCVTDFWPRLKIASAFHIQHIEIDLTRPYSHLPRNDSPSDGLAHTP
ncbi:hypothetical protein TNCV_1929291 [Trichonephila clavipes]|nr:hypothetical protein TNCV_1929291 [Trichonephila clavipes]